MAKAKRKPEPRKLTPLQKRFVEEYLVDLNATQAAIRAGYSPKYANRQAHLLLVNDRLQAFIRKGLEKREKRTEITADNVLRELAKMAFSDLVDFVDANPHGVTIKDFAELPKGLTACISEVSETKGDKGSNIKIKLHSKTAAVEMLMRHLSLFNDKLNVQGEFSWSDLARQVKDDEESGAGDKGDDGDG